jgi:hypothetical protein
MARIRSTSAATFDWSLLALLYPAVLLTHYCYRRWLMGVDWTVVEQPKRGSARAIGIKR